MSWIGSAITGGVSLLGGLIDNNTSKKNAQRAIRAQQEENQKNREYNLMLAQQQNAWNVEQWERENEYNSPVKQMERFKKAGMNPDLMVGGGAQNLAAHSPQMTAGAPSTPTDMSALGQVPTLGQAIQTALRDSMIGAQIDNIKADTKQKEADAEGKTIDNKYKDMFNELDIDLKNIQKNRGYQEAEMMYEQYELIKKEVSIKGESLKQMKLETLNKQIENSFKDREIKAIIKKLENEADISEQDAKFALESYTYRLLGLKSDALEAEDNISFLTSLNGNQLGETFTWLMRGIRYILNSVK